MAQLLADAIDHYDRFLRVERNLSPRTRAAYRYDLGRFGEWLASIRGGKSPRVGDVSATDIKEYLNHLKNDRMLKATSLSRQIASIRVFFDFCVEQGMIEGSPATSIHNPKMPRKLPVFMIESELRRLFATPDRTTSDGARDYAMMVTMAFCGVRLQELVGLDERDIDFERCTIRVLGKGAKERLIPINPIVQDALRGWLEARRAPFGEKAVFLNQRGQRITGRSVERILDKHVQAAGLNRPELSPHKLRHTFATLLHLRDVDLVEIQRLMGHATITSTQIYTHTNAEKLRHAVDRLRLDD
jgi:site-specific recombinase XerD